MDESPRARRNARRSRPCGTTQPTLGVILLLIQCGLLATSGAAAAPVGTAQQWETPPSRSMESMRRPIRLGREDGIAAKLKVIEITDRRFQPFLVWIELSGPRKLHLERVRFLTADAEFASELPPGARVRDSGGLFANQPTGPDDELHVREFEERSFNVTVDQAEHLARTPTLTLSVHGPADARTYEVDGDDLRKLQEWLLPRVERYRQEQDDGRND